MFEFNSDKEERKESKEVDKKQKTQQKGSGFREEHKDIKQSDFERRIAGTDPMKNDLPDENEERRTANTI
jgi:hypothetical protein